MNVTQDHDPGDEDRSPNGPWCSRCGDAFDDIERQCPNPAPGRPYYDCGCGRGGHMFDAAEVVTVRRMTSADRCSRR